MKPDYFRGESGIFKWPEHLRGASNFVKDHAQQ